MTLPDDSTLGEQNSEKKRSKLTYHHTKSSPKLGKKIYVYEKSLSNRTFHTLTNNFLDNVIKAVLKKDIIVLSDLNAKFSPDDPDEWWVHLALGEPMTGVSDS